MKAAAFDMVQEQITQMKAAAFDMVLEREQHLRAADECTQNVRRIQQAIAELAAKAAAPNVETPADL